MNYVCKNVDIGNFNNLLKCATIGWRMRMNLCLWNAYRFYTVFSVQCCLFIFNTWDCFLWFFPSIFINFIFILARISFYQVSAMISVKTCQYHWFAFFKFQHIRNLLSKHLQNIMINHLKTLPSYFEEKNSIKSFLLFVSFIILMCN